MALDLYGGLATKLPTAKQVANVNVNPAKSIQPFRYLVVLDFEATCDDNRRISPQEIIENPSSRSAKLRSAVKQQDTKNFKTDILEKFKNLIEIENYSNKL